MGETQGATFALHGWDNDDPAGGGLEHVVEACREQAEVIGQRSRGELVDPREVLTAISDGMVGLLKEFYGRGPTRTRGITRTTWVVCLLRGGFSRVEQTLLEGGRGPSVIQQRMDFQDLMRER